MHFKYRCIAVIILILWTLFCGYVIYTQYSLSLWGKYFSLRCKLTVSSEKRNKKTINSFYNLDICSKFSVYIYPNKSKSSTTHINLINALYQSKYFNSNPNTSCLFVPSIDTLNQDKLSNDYNYVNEKTFKENNIYWRNGTNHLIFNMYAGTYPDYNEKLSFETGNAIIVSSNSVEKYYRAGIDISFPLFNEMFVLQNFNHSNIEGSLSDLSKTLTASSVISSKSLDKNKHMNNDHQKYLLTFKGKRYVYGYGSETRNSLHYLHNGDDVILVTTCKHMDWKKYQDERCEIDNAEYDKWDYNDLLHHSTFCLVPRGRRLASYRFLEVLKAGCIPVVFSNGWVLPFSEVIDWSQASVTFDERNIFLLIEHLYGMTDGEIEGMQQRVRVIYHNYFSSFRRIIDTVLEIIKDRIHYEYERPAMVWNTHPGALNVKFEFSKQIRDFPFYSNLVPDFKFIPTYTVSILITEKSFSQQLSHNNNSITIMPPNILRIVGECYKSLHVSHIVFIWAISWSQFNPATVFNDSFFQQFVRHHPTPSSSYFKWLNTVGRNRYLIPTSHIRLSSNDPKNRAKAKFFYDSSVYRDKSVTDAIFHIDESVEHIGAREMDAAFEVWKLSPESIVGFQAYTHVMKPINSRPESINNGNDNFPIIQYMPQFEDVNNYIYNNRYSSYDYYNNDLFQSNKPSSDNSVLTFFLHRLFNTISQTDNDKYMEMKSIECSPYSIMNTHAIMYHRYYNYYYTYELSPTTHLMTEYYGSKGSTLAEDLAFNMMVSEITVKSPILMKISNSSTKTDSLNTSVPVLNYNEYNYLSSLLRNNVSGVQEKVLLDQAFDDIINRAYLQEYLAFLDHSHMTNNNNTTLSSSINDKIKFLHKAILAERLNANHSTSNNRKIMTPNMDFINDFPDLPLLNSNKCIYVKN